MAFRQALMYLGRSKHPHGLTMVQKSIISSSSKPSLTTLKIGRPMWRSYCDSIKASNEVKPEEQSKETPDAPQSVKAKDSEKCKSKGLFVGGLLDGPENPSEAMKLAAAALKFIRSPYDPDKTIYRNADKAVAQIADELEENLKAELSGEIPCDTPQENLDPPSATAPPVELTETEKNKQKLAELKNEVDTWKMKNLTLLEKCSVALEDQKALFDRLNKQIHNAQFFGISSLSRDLLVVADALATAEKVVDQSELEKDEALKQLYNELVLANQTLIKVFENHGLEKINPIHEKFDPHFHEALFQKEEATVEPNTVVEVTQLGYKLRDRVIRAALVGVSKTKNDDPNDESNRKKPT